MKSAIITTAACASMMSASTAFANFVVKDQTPSSVNDTAQGHRTGGGNWSIVADEPHLDAGDRNAPVTPKQSLHHRTRAVTGFGDQVPLAFACRQIVPARIKVSYGPGANPAFLVSWRGGETWFLVLGRAIKPLGLHIVEKGSTVAIRD